jgi:hypothetical protein
MDGGYKQPASWPSVTQRLRLLMTRQHRPRRSGRVHRQRVRLRHKKGEVFSRGQQVREKQASCARVRAPMICLHGCAWLPARVNCRFRWLNISVAVRDHHSNMWPVVDARRRVTAVSSRPRLRSGSQGTERRGGTVRCDRDQGALHDLFLNSSEKVSSDSFYAHSRIWSSLVLRPYFSSR